MNKYDTDPQCEEQYGTYASEPANEDQYDEPTHRGWPGDGTGEDDFQDYNQNEADDYSNE